MTTRPVAIFGSPEDSEVRSVASEVDRLGVDVRTVRPSPAEMRGWSWSEEGIRIADGFVLDRCRSVYVRSVPVTMPQPAHPIVGPGDEAAWLRTAEEGRSDHGVARAVQASLTERGIAVVNPMESSWFHRSKPAADARLADAGVAVPNGLVTQNRDEILGFLAEHGDVVAKPVAGGGACRAVTATDIEGPRGHTLTSAPVYFQERVPGRNLRVYTLDRTVVGACVIESDALDYRGHETQVDGTDPDGEAAELAVRAAEALDVVFAGIDIKDDDGRLVVLDVNPSPMFDAVSRRAGLSIAAALARRLVDGPPS